MSKFGAFFLCIVALGHCSVIRNRRQVQPVPPTNIFNNQGRPPITCGVIPEVDFAIVKNSSLTGNRTQAYQGDTAVYECIMNYLMIGDPQIMCSPIIERWTSLPVCLLTCGAAPMTEGATIIEQDFYGDQSLTGSTVKYACQVGLTLRRSDEIYCMPDGIWSGLPSCDHNGVLVTACGEPPKVFNGTIKSRSYVTSRQTWTDLIVYECDIGFHLGTSWDSISCQANGTWTVAPVCDPNPSCGGAPIVPNGIVIFTNFTNQRSEIKSVVQYKCRSGYRLNGSEIIICNEDQKWSAVPTCEINTCPPPPQISNAVIFNQTFPEGTQAYDGDRVSYQCNPGYIPLNRKATMVCLFDGRWTLEPQCVPGEEVPITEPETTTFAFTTSGVTRPQTCGAPNLIENGDIEFASFNYQSITSKPGDRVLYNCNEGYGLEPNVGTNPVYCDRLSLEWSEMPRCILNELLPPSPRPTLPRQPVFTLAPAGQCTPPEVIPFGNEVIRTFNGEYATVGDRIEYSCLIGYVMMGKNVITCNFDASWTEQPVCRPTINQGARTCGSPRNINNGRIQGRSFSEDQMSSPGDTLTYICNPGYRLYGNPVVVCDDQSLTWQLVPTCTKMTCGRLPQVANGYVSEANFQEDKSDVSSYGIYTCQPNFILRGLSRVECTETGQWTSPPRCESRPNQGPTCDSVPSVANAVVIYTTVPVETNFSIVGDMALYQCNEGYQPNKYPAIQCSATGWSEKPTCNLIPKRVCPDRVTLNWAIDLQEIDGFRQPELVQIQSFVRSIPGNFHLLTDPDLKPGGTPDTSTIQLGGVAVGARNYTWGSATISDNQDNQQATQSWSSWVNGNVLLFTNALNDDLVQVFDTVNKNLPQTASQSTGYRTIYLTTAKRGASLIAARKSVSNVASKSRVFVIAIGNQLSAWSQQSALRQEIATDVSYLKYYATPNLLKLETISQDKSFQDFMCSVN